jgi:hypothetical protein
MDFTDLLKEHKIDPRQVLVFRHRPREPKLNKVLPWLAAEGPEIFNAYQQSQGPTVEKAMTRAGYVASFIRHDSDNALFIGIFAIAGSKRITRQQFWRIPANAELRAKYGMRGIGEKPGATCLWFDLAPTEICADWKGKLIVNWPPPPRAWWRRAHKNTFSITAILRESALVLPQKDWRQMVFGWEELDDLPSVWKAALREWRGVYYIFDESDGKGYVGSAYGDSNLLGRWRNYAKSGHGGNALLRKRDARSFWFSILERVSPDMNAQDIIHLENTWKDRLHSRAPNGLNDN